MLGVLYKAICNHIIVIIQLLLGGAVPKVYGLGFSVYGLGSTLSLYNPYVPLCTPLKGPRVSIFFSIIPCEYPNR